MAPEVKILIVSPYPLSIRGGVTRFVEDLAEGLEKSGTRVSVCERSSADSRGVVGLIRDSLWGLKCFLKCASERPDAIHAHSHWSTALPGRLHKLFGGRSVHVFTFHTQLDREPAPIRAFLLSQLLSKCDHVSYVSSSLVGVYEGVLGVSAEKVVIYPSYRSVAVSQSQIDEFRKRFDLDEDATVMCFIGPLVWKEKVRGVELLIRCFSSVSESDPRLLLLIVGDGPLRRGLEEAAGTLGCSERVIFTGMLDNPHVPLAVSKIYAHISYQEGLPHSLLDAMVSSKAIVASRIGGIPEAITDGVEGLLVDNRETEVKDAIERLLREPELRLGLGEKAREKAKRLFGQERMICQFQRLYGGTK